MIQYLPYGGFKWLNQKDLNSVEESSSMGRP